MRGNVTAAATARGGSRAAVETLADRLMVTSRTRHAHRRITTGKKGELFPHDPPRVRCPVAESSLWREGRRGDPHDRRDTMATVRSISDKQLDANRRNARQSTGPTSEAGKHTSRLNAVTHGLLADEVVITAGAYQEDPAAFAQLLEALREQYTPEGVAEDLEVQTIARHYWRKLRAVRYEHGAIRTRTGDLREREALSLDRDFESDLSLGFDLERKARGIQYLIDCLDETKEEVVNGTLKREAHEWLEKYFPGEFAPPDEAQAGEQTAAGLAVSQDYGRQLVAMIDEQLGRLAVLREEVAAVEALNLDSKILAAALPASAAVDKLNRYETSNDRALDRALRRLEGMQARRRQLGGAPAEP